MAHTSTLHAKLVWIQSRSEAHLVQHDGGGDWAGVHHKQFLAWRPNQLDIGGD